MAVPLPELTLFAPDAWKDRAVTDVAAFLGVPREEVFALADAWTERAAALFAELGPERFYLAWQGEVGRSNLCANALFQFRREPYLRMLHHLATAGRRLDYADFGCGTATLSFPFLGEWASATLIDLPNLAQDFVRWRLQAHGLAHCAAVTPDAVSDGAPRFHVVTCIDVLEHVAQSSSLFAQIDASLHPGGIFLFSAPWHSIDPQAEHIPEAEADWKRPDGGAARLQERFTQLAALPHGGVYQKHRAA